MTVDGNDTIYCLANKPKANGSGREFLLAKFRPTIAAHEIDWDKTYSDGNSIPVSLSLKKKNNQSIICVSGNSGGDISILQYDSSGDTIWVGQYDCGNNGADVLNEMTIDKYGNLYLTGYSNCQGNNSDIKTLKYCICPPAVPDSINGITQICKQNSSVLSVPSDSTVEYYIWVLPDGWSGSSLTNEIVVTPSDSAVNGEIAVSAYSTFCSSPPRKTTLQVLSIPELPSINGISDVCSGIALNYSTPIVPLVDEYNWILPPGWTGPTTGNSISVMTGSESGTIQLISENECGQSSAQLLNVEVTITPDQPDVDGGTIYCAQDEAIFSVINAGPGYEYHWTLPSGWSAGTITDPTLEAFAGQSGVISVYGQNGLCRSDTTVLPVTVYTTPAVPIIEGDDAACIHDSVTFSIIPQIDASGHIWLYPADWIIVDSNSSSITVEILSAGSVSAMAINMCDSSEFANFPVDMSLSAPAAPGEILGPDTICAGSTATWMIADTPEASSYEWFYPTGWNVQGSSNSTSLTLTANDLGGIIRVRAVNDCGRSPASPVKEIVVSPFPDTTVQVSNETLFSVQNNATYQWKDCISGTLIAGATMQSFSPTYNSTYSVIINNDGCIVESECIPFIHISVIESGNDEPVVLVFPNPSTGVINVFSKSGEIDHIKVVSISGQSLFEEVGLNSTSTLLDISHLPEGVYLIQMRSGAIWHHQRIAILK